MSDAQGDNVLNLARFKEHEVEEKSRVDALGADIKYRLDDIEEALDLQRASVAAIRASITKLEASVGVLADKMTVHQLELTSMLKRVLSMVSK